MTSWTRRLPAILGFSIFTAIGGICSAQQKMAKAADEIFADLTKPGSPGCALAAARDGKIVYENGYGLANIEESVSITPQTVFDIGSTSKQFTAASILLLEKQGKLSIHDDVRKYLPEIPDYGRTITILHLLNHTSGLRDYLTLFELAGVNIDSVTSDDDALAIIARQKALNFAPGNEWLYSNSGFFLLSVIVKRVSGKSLREFATENLFDPLKMEHTVFRNEHTQLVANRALAYEPTEAGTGYTLNVSYFEQTGDGAVHTSVEDLLKWDENFYSGKLGGPAFLAEIQEPGKLNDGKTLDYAKGLFVGKYRGLRFVDHGGSWGGYRAQLLRFPDQHFSVACLCNAANARPDRRAHQIADIFLAADMKEPKPPEREQSAQDKKQTVSITPEKLKLFEGKFKSEELLATYSIASENGELLLTGIRSGDGFLHSAQHRILRSVGQDTFLVDEDGLEFIFDRHPDGSVSGFKLSAGRTKGLVFNRN